MLRGERGEGMGVGEVGGPQGAIESGEGWRIFLNELG